MAGLRIEARGECATYRSDDSVANLRVKISLRKQSAFSVSQRIIEQEQQEGIELRSLAHQQISSTDIEEYVFSWQEKVFSQREFDTYKLKENCKTSLEDKYHATIHKLRKKGRPTKRLFSYIDADDYLKKNEMDKSLTTSSERKDNIIIKRFNSLQIHKNIKSDNSALPKTNLVLKPSDQHKNHRNHVKDSNLQTMVLMADLNDLDKLGSDLDLEVILCIIQVTKNGVLFITPDFTNGRQTYSLEVEANQKLFEYTIENASPSMKQEEKEKEREKLQKEFTGHQSDIMRNEFEMPAVGVLKTYLFGEIVSSCDFEANNLYVNYIFNLPENWYAANESQELYGTTHACSTKPYENTDVAHFNFPFSVELILKIQDNNSDQFAWPRLFLEVWSQDFWNRYRIEGYGYLTLPFSPGTYEYEIGMLRPISSSLQARLHRFFLGSGSELEGIVFSAIPVNTFKQSKSAQSSLGLLTEGSGKVKMRINIIHQAAEYISKGTESLNKALQNIRPKTEIETSIQTVLEAFHRARRRMQEAKENIQYTDDLMSEKSQPISRSAQDPLSRNILSGEQVKSQSSSYSLDSSLALEPSDYKKVEHLQKSGKKMSKHKRQEKLALLQESSPRILSKTSNDSLPSSQSEHRTYPRLKSITKESISRSTSKTEESRSQVLYGDNALDDSSDVGGNNLEDIRGSRSESEVQSDIKRSETEGEIYDLNSSGSAVRTQSELSRMRRRRKKGNKKNSDGEIT